MYRIFNDGRTIAICDKPTYIRLKEETGVYVSATGENAQGIAVAGVPYNLPGHDEIKLTDGQTAPEAYAMEIDGGELLTAEIAGAEGRTGDVLCGLDASIEEIKDVLCELDARLEGGSDDE
jgi:hypothetical protein